MRISTSTARELALVPGRNPQLIILVRCPVQPGIGLPVLNRFVNTMFLFLFFSFLFSFSFLLFSSHRSGHHKFHNYTNHNFTRVTTITRFNFRRIKNSSQGSQEYITITRFHFTRLEKNHKIRIHNNYKSSLAEFPTLYAAGGARPLCLWLLCPRSATGVARRRQAAPLRTLLLRWPGPHSAAVVTRPLHTPPPGRPGHAPPSGANPAPGPQVLGGQPP